MAENPVERTLAKQIVDLAGRIAELQGRVEALEKINIRAVELLSPGPDDVLIVTLPDVAPIMACDNIRKGFRNILPKTKIAVVQESLKVTLVRAADVTKELANESAIATE